jgi:serine/threonine protein kinase
MLRHDALVRVVDVLPDVETGCPALVMELLEGETLATRLQQGALSSDAAVGLAAALAEALAYVHEAGVVHRDIKPGNVLLVSADVAKPKLLDLGLATVVEDGPLSTLSRITRTGHTAGTLAYMAPEQLAGEQVDGRVDVWALGVVLYECVFGRTPFTGRTPADLLRTLLSKRSVQIAADSFEGAALLATMLAASPNERPTMREVAKALSRAACTRT